MPSTPRFNLWRRWRPVVQTKENRQTITLDAFETECCFPLGSLYVVADAFAAPHTEDNIPIVVNSLTLDFYAKNLQSSNGVIMKVVDVTTGEGLVLSYTAATNTLRFSVVHSGGTQNNDVSFQFINEWNRITLAFDENTDILTLFINNELIGAGAAIVGTISFPNDAKIIAGSSTTSTGFAGYIAEIRLWDTAFDINAVMSTVAYRSALDTNLIYYVRTRDVTNTPIVGTSDFITNSLTAEPSTEEFVIIPFGASWIVAQWEVDLGEKTSLVFPVEAPEDVQFALVVRWVDNDGEIQRRKLWDVEGVDIAPDPADYAGESLASSFFLEAWNIDGVQTVALEEDLVLYLGLTTEPTTDVDHDSQEAATLTIDTTLAQEFPLTPFPLTFDTQQVF